MLFITQLIYIFTIEKICVKKKIGAIINHQMVTLIFSCPYIFSYLSVCVYIHHATCGALKCIFSLTSLCSYFMHGLPSQHHFY